MVFNSILTLSLDLNTRSLAFKNLYFGSQNLPCGSQILDGLPKNLVQIGLETKFSSCRYVNKKRVGIKS